VAAFFLAPLLAHPDRQWVLRNHTRQQIVAERLEAAIDSPSRRKGLLGRSGLAAGAGLVLAPCRGIHTAFMQFPIDVIFVRRDGSIARVIERLQPWRVGVSPFAYATVELPAGTVHHTATRAGDILQLEGP
jgi:uncharacterized membrane protein (UPF0127 family)